jgi:fumarylacetoacetase
MTMFDSTTDSALRSWVESANDPATDFPIQNLPFGVFARRGSNDRPRVGVAIGDRVIDVTACATHGLFATDLSGIVATCTDDHLNGLMRLGRSAATKLRAALSDLMTDGSNAAKRAARVTSDILVPMRECVLSVPARIGDYTDFYASIHHARNVGSMFRPDNPLLPNYKWIPIGYHGRASSIVPTGTPVRRPLGQTRDATEDAPSLGPSRRLDYELEVGIFIGQGNELGMPSPIDEAESHVFGLCLVNDWSARDIQSWEYQPLGPFLAKSFATTVSPWVVALDALAPFRVPAVERELGDPAPLPYLDSPINERSGGVAISLEVLLSTDQMRAASMPPFRVSAGSFAEVYWTIAQLVTHHTSNGCNLRPGDLLASGTVSGASKESRGCLLERAWRGTEPVRLPTGETRSFLQDGDEVTLRGYCEREGYRRIGFGECAGRIVAALAP